MVATMLPGLQPGDHTDPATPGLQLRVREKRGESSRTWLLRYRWDAEYVRIVLGHLETMSLSEARERALEMRRAIDNGIDPRRARPRRRSASSPLPMSATSALRGSKHTVDFLASEFMARHVRPHRKRPEYAQAIIDKDVLPEWRGRDARSIEPAEVIALLDKIVDRGRPVMANRTAALLGQLFKFGVHRRIIANTPVQLLYRPGGKEKARARTLSEAELSKLLRDPQAATRYERLSRVITLLLLTGQRRGELALASWSEIDFAAMTWTIPDENAKGGRGHVVPLTDWAVEEFLALLREAEGSKWVLPATDPNQHLDPKQLTRSAARCQERMAELGIGAFTLHDLRRTCRTGLGRLKVPPHIAERVLNHAQEKIAGTYDLFEYLEEKRAALEKWATHLKDLTRAA